MVAHCTVGGSLTLALLGFLCPHQPVSLSTSLVFSSLVVLQVVFQVFDNKLPVKLCCAHCSLILYLLHAQLSCVMSVCVYFQWCVLYSKLPIVNTNMLTTFNNSYCCHRIPVSTHFIPSLTQRLWPGHQPSNHPTISTNRILPILLLITSRQQIAACVNQWLFFTEVNAPQHCKKHKRSSYDCDNFFRNLDSFMF